MINTLFLILYLISKALNFSFAIQRSKDCFQIRKNNLTADLWCCGLVVSSWNRDILLKWLLLKTFSAVMSCFDHGGHVRPACCRTEKMEARRSSLSHTKPNKQALVWCNIGSGARNDYKTCHSMSLQSLLRKAEQYDAAETEREMFACIYNAIIRRGAVAQIIILIF